MTWHRKQVLSVRGGSFYLNASRETEIPTSRDLRVTFHMKYEAGRPSADSESRRIFKTWVAGAILNEGAHRAYSSCQCQQ
jgi:hypothetical protein